MFAAASLNVSAQAISVSDSELRNFILTYKSLQEIQENGNENMEKALIESELPEAAFFEMYELSLNAPTEIYSRFSSEYTTLFNELMETFNTIQEEAKDKMVSTIEERGMTVARFNLITEHLRRNPSLQERVREMEDEMMRE